MKLDNHDHETAHYHCRPISSNATLTFSRLVIPTNICFLSICVHYDAEIECAVIDTMQLKNLEREFMTVPRMGL